MRRHESSNLGMPRCTPMTYSRRFKHLSLGMPKASLLFPQQLLACLIWIFNIPSHILCQYWVVFCFYLLLPSFSFTPILFFLLFFWLLFWFLLFLPFAFFHKMKTTKIFSFLLLLYLDLPLVSIWFFSFGFSLKFSLLFLASFCTCLPSGLLLFFKNKMPS